MKNLLLILCSLLHIGLFQTVVAQQRPELYLGGGLLNGPKEAYFVSGKGGSLGAYFPFLTRRNFNLGIDLGGGMFASKQRSNQSLSPYSFSGISSSYVGLDSSMSSSQRILRFGAGPRADIRLGQKLQLSAAIEGGIAHIRQDAIAYDQYLEVAGPPVKKRIYSRDEIDSRSFQLMPRLRIAYPLGDNLKIWAEGNYLLSNYNFNEQLVQTVNAEGNPIRELGQFVEAGYTNNVGRDAWNALGGQVGVALQLGKRKNIAKDSKVKHADSRASSVFSREEIAIQEVKEKRSLQPVLPKNNSQFNSNKEVQALNWRLLGSALPAAKYSVELVQLGGLNQPHRTYHGQSAKPSIAVAELTKGQELAEGRYRWQVTELSTGMVTQIQFFAIGNCDIQFTIQDENISCLGYVGENRKYRICFNSVYASASGDLTYTQSGTGLMVYDQSNTPLTYALVAPQPNLLPQVGATSSTVQYCFEVEVPTSVTAIGIGLQGDDLDPGPILCQPGVGIVIDSLPECICEDCKDMILTFDPVQIHPSQTIAHAFNFQGDIQVNQPIYAVEIQVLSYQYSADPTPCSAGITALEQAGMLLRNGSTINNSNDLNFYTSAANPNSNPNASKVVKYMSPTAMSGSIPVSLNVGLPGPATGFDADCCKMSYEVCFKIVIYYDQDNCKSCVFTKCFQFTN